MDLIVYVPNVEKIFRISEGDGCNLTDEDIKAGYEDYLYYDVYDIQELSEVEDGGEVLLEKYVSEEFNNISEIIERTLNMGGIFGLSYQILSGEKYWKKLVGEE